MPHGWVYDLALKAEDPHLSPVYFFGFFLSKSHIFSLCFKLAKVSLAVFHFFFATKLYLGCCYLSVEYFNRIIRVVHPFTFLHKIEKDSNSVCHHKK